jgi:hypothetical protein
LTAEAGAAGAAGAAALTTWVCLPSFKNDSPKNNTPQVSPEAMLLQQQTYLIKPELALTIQYIYVLYCNYICIFNFLSIHIKKLLDR